MKRYIKVLILLVFLSISIGTVSVDGAIGYTYSHRGRPIYSTVGMSVSADGIFTVVSNRWTNTQGEALPAGEFTSPEDLFIYTETINNVEKDIIYIVDSVSNNMFVFDGDLNYQYKVTQYEVLPENFTDEEVLRFRTRFVDAQRNISTLRFSEYLTRKNMTIADFRAIADIPYEERTANQKFYIDCYGLSGVYRNVRPVRRDDGSIVRGQFQDLIYLSDKTNNQIVIVDSKTYEVVQVVSTPTDISFKDKIFSPVKVVTDVTGWMYVISEGVYEGIMMMTYDGDFSSFVGVNYVTLSFWQIFWRRFLTDTQLALQQPTLNTIFTSLAIDEEDFIYTTSRAVGTDDSRMIKRINPSGRDVLTRNGYSDPKGDLAYIRAGGEPTMRGPSRFSAITVNDYGVYTVACQKMGRLFTYDDEGNLLYISGGNGNELNDLNNPVAIQYQGENILALDKRNQAVLRFVPTEIAVSINKAVRFHYEGNLVASSEEWKSVVNQNPNYEYAYVGIGKSLLNEGRFQEAMSYFQIGYSRDYYSKAYKLYRDDIVGKYFSPIMFVVLIGAAAIYSYKGYRYMKYGKPDEGSDDL